MKCRLLVFFRSPKTGTLLSGKPDEEWTDIPDDDYAIGDEVFLSSADGSRRMLEVVGRRWVDREKVVVCREHRVWGSP